ncbi:MAG: beta-ketoacyl-[acyl-carrier-protein] synthase family protein, partial [Comamonadaceae bacterium]
MSSQPQGAASIGVTGIGLVTPMGLTLAAFDDALFAGRSAVTARTLEVDGLEPIQLSVAACDFDDSAKSASRLPLDRG